MRNNTKLKNILKDNDLVLSMSEDLIEAMVIDKEHKTSFIVTGSSITVICNEIKKYLAN